MGLTQAEQICRAAWYLHTYKNLTRFQPKDLTAFFNTLNLSPPNVHTNVKKLYEKKPRVFMWDKGGYYLEGKFHRSLNDQLRSTVGAVESITSRALHSISEKVVDPFQRTFLAEALGCYRISAYRATIVMAWNLAYSHFCIWLISDKNRLAAFNLSLTSKYPRKNLQILVIDDFSELKEFEAIEIARHARNVTKNVADIMQEKLKKRNAAAHPSSIAISQSQADDVITDLVNNVVAKLT